MSNIDVVKNAYEAFADGDMEAFLGAMDPDMEWREAEGNPYIPSGDPFIGPEEILNNLFKKLGEEWDLFTFHPQTYHDAGDTIIVEGRYLGKYRKTGKHMDLQVCHFWEVKNGKLTRFQQYANTAEFQDVMGV